MNTSLSSGLSTLAFFFFSAALAAGCASQGSLNRGGGNSGNNGSGGSGASGGGTGLTSFGGQQFGNGGNGAGGLAACQAQSEPAQLTPVNIVFIIDKSGSMGVQYLGCTGDTDCQPSFGTCDTTKGTCTIAQWDNVDARWNPVRDAMIAFLQNPGTEGLEASLTFFPDGGQPTAPNTGVCSVDTYAYPSVKLTSLDDSTKSQQLVTILNSTVPGGGTPTLPAVQGAIQYATQAATDTPGSRSVVVLVTDGQPGVAAPSGNEQCSCYGDSGCTTTAAQTAEVDKVATIAQAAAEGTPSILTYVIGMGEADKASLNKIASAGGTDQAFFVDTGDPAQTQAQFTDALGAIRSVRAPCNIQMPLPPTDQQFDKLKVNVEFVSGSGTSQPLYYAGSLAASLGGSQLTCPNPGPPAPANPWYWTYDNEDNPTQIILCPSACAQTEGDAQGRVDIAYGCATNVDVH